MEYAPTTQTKELVHRFLLMGKVLFHMSPMSRSSAEEARSRHTFFLSVSPGRLSRMSSPVDMPRSAVEMAGSVERSPSGSCMVMCRRPGSSIRSMYPASEPCMVNGPAPSASGAGR